MGTIGHSQNWVFRGVCFSLNFTTIRNIKSNSHEKFFSDQKRSFSTFREVTSDDNIDIICAV